MLRVTFSGDGVQSLRPELPAASVRLLLPAVDRAELVMPTWDGNVFLLPNGSRAPIRTLTPLRVGEDEIDLDVVLHDGGRLSGWAETATPGVTAAISGPGRGYRVDPSATQFVLAGDETAMPAIGQLITRIRPAAAVAVLAEVARADARVALPGHPGLSICWLDLPPGAAPGDALVTAVAATPVGSDTRVWAAGEAAAMFRVRRHLFEELGHRRAHAVVRGYWKAGRTGDAGVEG